MVGQKYGKQSNDLGKNAALCRKIRVLFRATMGNNGAVKGCEWCQKPAKTGKKAAISARAGRILIQMIHHKKGERGSLSMGGYGSGRWGLHIKAQTVEMAGARLEMSSQLADTIRSGGGRYRLTCNAQPSQAGALGALLGNLESRVYRWAYEVVEGGQAIIIDHGQPGRPVTERIAIARRALRYGARLFWLCPGCSRRAGILYRQRQRWRCRRCHGLTYRSAQEADKRVYALVRAIDTPAALDRIAAGLDSDNPAGSITGLLLLMKAHDILRKRNRRELRKLGIMNAL
jgi:hypothetical protein